MKRIFHNFEKSGAVLALQVGNYDITSQSLQFVGKSKLESTLGVPDCLDYGFLTPEILGAVLPRIFNVRSLQVGQLLNPASFLNHDWDRRAISLADISPALQHLQCLDLNVEIDRAVSEDAHEYVTNLLKCTHQLEVLRIEWVRGPKIFRGRSGVTLPKLREAEFVGCGFTFEDVITFVKNHKKTLKRFALSENNHMGNDAMAARHKIKQLLDEDVGGHQAELEIVGLEDDSE